MARENGKSFQDQLKDIIEETNRETVATNSATDSRTDCIEAGEDFNIIDKTQMPYNTFEQSFNKESVEKALNKDENMGDKPVFQKSIRGNKEESYKELHKGRRQRVRNSVDADPEFDSFAEHEVLEYILFDTVKRVDTNPYAHQLIDYFGSLWGVLNANINELMQFTFVNELTARRIKSYIPIVRRAEISRLKNNVILDTTQRASSYLKAHLSYRNKELIYAACLDVNDRLLSVCRISQGDTSAVQLDIKRIAEAAFSSGAAKIILAHNHPAETLSPSQDDISATKRLCISLLSMNILLVDHIIFTSDDYFSFYLNGLMNDVYENCDNVMGSQVCRQFRQRKIGLPSKYVLENDNHKYFVEQIGEESTRYEKISINKLFPTKQ